MILLFSHSPSVIAFSSVKPSQTMRAADREPAGGEIPVELVAASRLMTSHSGPGCRGQIGLLSYRPDSGTGLWKRERLFLFIQSGSQGEGNKPQEQAETPTRPGPGPIRPPLRVGPQPRRRSSGKRTAHSRGEPSAEHPPPTSDPRGWVLPNRVPSPFIPPGRTHKGGVQPTGEGVYTSNRV